MDDGQLDYYFERWQEVLHNLGDDYKTQERFFRQNYDAFRREVNKPFIGESGSQLPLGSVATRSNLLKIYEKRMEADDGALKVLDELTENSALYSKIIGLDQESPDSELSHQLLELSRAQGVASYLMLLFLFKKQNQLELKDETLALLVKLLVCFFVRRNLTDTLPHVTLRDSSSVFARASKARVSRALQPRSTSRSASSTCLPATLPSENVLRGRFTTSIPI